MESNSNFFLPYLPAKTVASAYKNTEITARGISWDLAALVVVLVSTSLFTHSKREDLYTGLVNPPILWRQTVARAEVASSTIHHIHWNAYFCKAGIFSNLCIIRNLYLPVTFAMDMGSKDRKQSLSLAKKATSESAFSTTLWHFFKMRKQTC